jgi:hypothetical protein
MMQPLLRSICEHSPIVTHNIGFKLENAVGMGDAR